MAAENNMGAELAYPSMAAAIMAAALATLLGVTIGQVLIDRNVIEIFLREWLPPFLPFFYLLPHWAREAPWVLAAIGAIAVITVRLLAGYLPRTALYILIVGVVCTGLLLGMPMRAPASANDWAFVSYVILIAFLGGSPPAYRVPD